MRRERRAGLDARPGAGARSYSGSYTDADPGSDTRTHTGANSYAYPSSNSGAHAYPCADTFTDAHAASGRK